MIFLAAISFLAGGCAPKVHPYTAKEAIDALTAQAVLVKTERGRAWVSARSPEQKLSFPAVIAIDRNDASKTMMRIEAMDPLGATHALILLEKGSKLTWVDFDQRRTYRLRDNWYGIPLTKLPELVLGLAALPTDGVVGAADPEGFQVRSGANVFRYLMSWIDPGPRLALGGVDAELGQKQKYVVRNSQFLDKDDFYLPREVKLVGYKGTADVEMSISWRERKWNEEIPAQVFTLPEAAVRGFSK